VVWLGVREWLIFGGILVFTAAAAALKLIAARKIQRPSAERYAFAGYVFNVLACLFVGRGFGPLLFMPMLLVMFTYGNSATDRKAYRSAVVATGCIAVLAAAWIEYAGIFPRSYVFHDGALTLLPRAVAHSEIPTMAALALTTIFMLVVPAFIVGQHQNALRDAERRAFLQSWQLRHLLPERARPKVVTAPQAPRAVKPGSNPPKRRGDDTARKRRPAPRRR
jgi:serine/threonine-protein kinase